MLITKDLNEFTYPNEENRTHNSRFAKAGVPCFYVSEVLNSSFVHLMKYNTENPRLRKAANRYASCYDDTLTTNEQTEIC